MHDIGADRIIALRTRGVAMDKVYPTGTTVFCVPIEDYDGELESGDRVVCFLRSRDDADAIELRELKITKAGRAWLLTRSDHPDYQEPIRLAWPPGSEAAAITERGVYKIVAVVVAAYLREPVGVRIVEEAQLRWRELSRNRSRLSPAVLKTRLVDRNTRPRSGR